MEGWRWNYTPGIGLSCPPGSIRDLRGGPSDLAIERGGGRGLSSTPCGHLEVLAKLSGPQREQLLQKRQIAFKLSAASRFQSCGPFNSSRKRASIQVRGQIRKPPEG